MTGEVTLRGKVLEIGGVKEKVLAAYRAGLRQVIMPKANEKDLRDVPDEVKKNMNFMFVDRMDEVLHLALLRPATNELADHVEPEASTVDRAERTARGSRRAGFGNRGRVGLEKLLTQRRGDPEEALAFKIRLSTSQMFCERPLGMPRCGRAGRHGVARSSSSPQKIRLVARGIRHPRPFPLRLGGSALSSCRGLLEERRDHVDEQTRESADDRSVDADELKISPDRQLDAA